VRASTLARVTTVCYTTGITAHTIGVMRPFNYTTFTADAAAAQAVVNIKDNPGLYATTYKYPKNGTLRVADNGIAASDYVAYQCADGTWNVDTVASVSVLAVTLTNTLPTGGVTNGGLLYFFGVIGDSDPATALVNPQTQIAASLTRDKSWSDSVLGVMQALHPGDPLLFYSPNTTNAGILEFISGFYGTA